MVHALDDAWRVLKEDGILIDLRPMHTDMSLYSVTDDQSTLITTYTDAYRQHNDNQADTAIAQIASENYFVLENSITFDYLRIYDSGDELLSYNAGRNPPIKLPEIISEQLKTISPASQATIHDITSMLLKTYRRTIP